MLEDLIFLEWRIAYEDSEERLWIVETPEHEYVMTVKQKIVKKENVVGND